ncbi:MAG: bicyclomycin resistance protein, partial [Inhella sp.]
MTLLNRRHALALGTGALALPARSPAAGPKRLRVAADIAEVGFDPPRVSDRPSVTSNAPNSEARLTTAPLPAPALRRPLTAATMPEVS